MSKTSDQRRRGSFGRTEFLCHAALWYGLLFATPLFIALRNRQDLPIDLSALAAALLVLFLSVTVISYSLAGLMSGPRRMLLASTLLAIAVVVAIQGNLLHPLADFGQFDGSIVNFRKYGGYFWLEWYGFLSGLGLLIWLFSRMRPVPQWLAWLPLLSFTLLWLPALRATDNNPIAASEAGYNNSVFEFSKKQNLVHLLPDGLQSDIVNQVFTQKPELAERFQGFTLFADHLGMYHGTAPALPTLLTGKPFAFERGHSYQWITPFIEQHSYQNKLADQGFELDLVHIDKAYCIKRARSCVSRPFSDWKSRGYARQKSDNVLYSLKLLADLSLYRLSPAFLKEKIHNQGEWLLSDSSMDGASPWPDPVIREWVEHMQVSKVPPRYKWYHYIGTHKPPFWDGDCRRQSGLERSRQNFLNQAECILEGIALLLDKLKSEGIYDQTAIIVTGDHGDDITPLDSPATPETVALSSEMMGTARPALLVKPMNARHVLQISNVPTSLQDVPAMALHLADPGNKSLWQPDGNRATDSVRERYFFRYPVEKLARWNTQPIPYDTYRVRGPVNEEQSWELLNIQDDVAAPGAYPLISYRTASRFFRGLKLSSNDPDKELAWINRKQLAFLLSMPKTRVRMQKITITLHVPEWVGELSFAVRVNDTDLATVFKIQAESSFWQEVDIGIPLTSARDGNNFISLSFDALHTAPDAPNLKAAALLKSIMPASAVDSTQP